MKYQSWLDKSLKFRGVCPSTEMENLINLNKPPPERLNQYCYLQRKNHSKPSISPYSSNIQSKEIQSRTKSYNSTLKNHKTETGKQAKAISLYYQPDPAELMVSDIITRQNILLPARRLVPLSQANKANLEDLQMETERHIQEEQLQKMLDNELKQKLYSYKLKQQLQLSQPIIRQQKHEEPQTQRIFKTSQNSYKNDLLFSNAEQLKSRKRSNSNHLINNTHERKPQKEFRVFERVRANTNHKKRKHLNQ